MSRRPFWLDPPHRLGSCHSLFDSGAAEVAGPTEGRPHGDAEANGAGRCPPRGASPWRSPPGVAGAAKHGPGGNSENAKKCQGTGYLNWTTTTGTTFDSADACTAYAAHGGVLVAATHNLRVLVLNESPRFLAIAEVTSDPAGIDCVQGPEGLNTCDHEFTAGTTVTLTEMPGPGALPPGANFLSGTATARGRSPRAR